MNTLIRFFPFGEWLGGDRATKLVVGFYKEMYNVFFLFMEALFFNSCEIIFMTSDVH